MGRKKPLVEWQKTREIDSTPSNNYASWRDRRHYSEEAIRNEKFFTGNANPDLYGDTTDEPGRLYEENELKTRVKKLYKKAEQILTERQHQVFELVGIRAMSFQKAATELSKEKAISRQAVAHTWARVRDKLSKVKL